MPRQTNERSLEYRQAWSRFATGVTVITTVEPDGGIHGMTANGITSASLDPPLALICIGHNRNTYGLVERTGRFGISVLSTSQQAVAEFFTLPPEERAEAVPASYVELPRGCPVIDGALTQMGCRVVDSHEASDHTIFVAEVEDFATRGGSPLVWYEGRFKQADERPL